MLRVRHTVNTSNGVLLQFRDYKATANRIETIDESKVKAPIDINTGKWLCTFFRPKLISKKPRMLTLVISSKKKFVEKFKKFVLSDFPKSKEESEEDTLIKVTNDIITNISKLVNEIRKSVTGHEIVQVNTLINHTFLELNTLQSKIIELEESKK